MTKSFTCPYCQKEVAKSMYTYKEFWVSRNSHTVHTTHIEPPQPGQMLISYYSCPSCDQITITATVDHGDYKNMVNIEPLSLAKRFPDYVPEAIRKDYEEACSIANLSPKASATLSRRCLQSMIRDFWQISGKSRLVDEIDALKEKVPAAQWKVLNSLRCIGNIGAHPEADVSLIIEIEPEDARKLISIIELLIKQWYIERYEQEQLYSDILALDKDTKSQKKKG